MWPFCGVQASPPFCFSEIIATPPKKNKNPESASATCGKATVIQNPKKAYAGARGGTGAEAFGFDDRFKCSHHLVT